MTSGGSCIISLIASWRSCVAEQMVPNDRKCSLAWSSPLASAIISRRRAPMAIDSLASMVVWLATPTFRKSRSGSKSGDVRSRNKRKNSFRPSRPGAPVMYAPTFSASAMFRKTKYLPPSCRFTWLAVARDSSCWCLPWMIAVKPSRA